jgi:hypothetical protein
MKTILAIDFVALIVSLGAWLSYIPPVFTVIAFIWFVMQIARCKHVKAFMSGG